MLCVLLFGFSFRYLFVLFDWRHAVLKGEVLGNKSEEFKTLCPCAVEAVEDCGLYCVFVLRLFYKGCRHYSTTMAQLSFLGGLERGGWAILPVCGHEIGRDRVSQSQRGPIAVEGVKQRQRRRLLCFWLRRLIFDCFCGIGPGLLGDFPRDAFLTFWTREGFDSSAGRGSQPSLLPFSSSDNGTLKVESKRLLAPAATGVEQTLALL